MKAIYFLKKIKDVKPSDYFSFVKFLVAVCVYPFFRLRHKYEQIWVVCETENEARDNGYWFYKYMCDSHREVNTYYAINYKSVDYKKVRVLGNTVKYGSVKHWLLYLCAEYNISSQKGGKPNAAICAFLELLGLIDSKLVFLQHGVIVNNVTWAHADITQLKYFVTSTIPETDYIRENFGFNPEKIILTGMPRFDNLHDCSVDRKYVLIMPTWRSRFSLKSEKHKVDNNFLDSEYKRCWEGLLNSRRFADVVDRYDLKVVFFPHRNMQKFLSQFKLINEKILIADWRNYDIQEEMKKAALMITDYSSVFFDMVYMKKPVIFYQFDYDDFRSYDYREGYFDYRNNPFGKSVVSYDGVAKELDLLMRDDCKVDEAFQCNHEKIFKYYDDRNSERIYEILIASNQ